MKIVQAFWDGSEGEGKLYLWGEDTDQIQTSPSKRGRKNTIFKLGPSRTPTHPFMISAGDLKEITEECGSSRGKWKKQATFKEVRLPTRENRPCGSDTVIGATGEEENPAPYFAWWNVACTTYSGPELYPALMKVVHNIYRQAPKCTCGSTLRFWLQVMQGACGWIYQHKIIPAVQEVRQNDQVAFQASWAALWDDATIAWKTEAARAMPPACYACWAPEGILKHEAARLSFKEALVETFASMVIQGLLRKIQNGINRTSLWDFEDEDYNYRRKSMVKNDLASEWLEDLLQGSNNLEYYGGYYAYPSREILLLRELARDVAQYYSQSPIVVGASPVRLCLKLTEPPKDLGKAPRWDLSFHLQVTSQPQILIPARDIWATAEEFMLVANATISRPQEFLIKSLLKASLHYQPINEVLQDSCPEAIALTTKQAYDFLNKWADELKLYDIGVRVPDWWRSKESGVGAVLHITATREKESGGDIAARIDDGNMGFNIGSLLTYDWRLSIGKEIISAAEFTQLIKKNLPLVLFNDSWVEINPARQLQILSLLEQKKKRPPEMTLGKALRLGLGQEMLPEGITVVGIVGTGNLKTLLEKFSSNAPLSPVGVPPSFSGKLRPYQERGLSWLAFLRQFQFGACLADDMGLGKTIETIALLLYDQQKWASAKQKPPANLLICPMSIVGNWFHELKTFSPSLKVLIHHGNMRPTKKDFTKVIQDYDVILTTFALAHRDLKDLLRIQWNYIIVDEAQNIKNHATKQTLAIKQLHGIHKLALTGTPVENRIAELWSIMDFLNPGYLGGLEEFHGSFERPITKKQDTEKIAVLKRIIQPFVLRRLKTDKTIINDLPEKVEIKDRCNITPEQASIYQGLVDLMLGKIDAAEGITRKGLILATLMKLKQVCDHPRIALKAGGKIAGRSGKLTRLEEMLEEVLEDGEKALIFTQFVEMGNLLQQHLQDRFGMEVLFLRGSTPQPQRDAMVSRFQDPADKAAVFILSLKAGGVGLNLTAANHVFHYDRWWNPAVENQATDRAYRIGQQKKVIVHKIICVGTLEEQIDNMLEQKRALAENIIGSGEIWLTEMSTDQLRSIFALQRDNVFEEKQEI